MKIQFLGTAAFEGVPALFCNCRVCKQSRKLGGKNIRTRSQALIDDRLLIDFPADTYMHMLCHNFDLPSIKTCIITHNHSDHLYTADIEARNIDYANDVVGGPLTFYGDCASYEDVTSLIKKYKTDEVGRATAKRITPFVPFEAEGYTITPLRAAHDPNSDPLIYIIQKDGKAVLYGHDTGVFPSETWEWLEKNPVKLDLVSLDCTMAPDNTWWGHMGLKSCIKVRERLIENNLTDNSTKYVLHHFSHNSGYTYDEFTPIAEKEKFIVAYDGMTIEV